MVHGRVLSGIGSGQRLGCEVSEVGGRLGCARANCGLPKLHAVHVGSGWQHEYRKPERIDKRHHEEGAPVRRPGVQRKTFGAERKRSRQTEAGWAKFFEDLLLRHRVEWWHNYNAMRSKSGWPDYAIFGQGWHAFVEIKARSPEGRRGNLTAAQIRFASVIQDAGGEWLTFCFPDDIHSANDWLGARTGIVIEIPYVRDSAVSGVAEMTP